MPVTAESPRIQLSKFVSWRSGPPQVSDQIGGPPAVCSYTR
ncbi:hypothetical protein I5G81_gp20 [Mycobacterium phage Shandong1]|uniref:Uncharacterized protein n=1 Tax=Mycobacterium phage Shandong1 TaxID=1983447 RepID=A0A1X9SHD5_9CAUD|nr:hypothetical protein I5G81_gp20 [Mycobacterium phage Shandong1]ARQ95459.1 hypothetical protein [Mycobacterium phage Shandong1]